MQQQKIKRKKHKKRLEREIIIIKRKTIENYKNKIKYRKKY